MGGFSQAGDPPLLISSDSPAPDYVKLIIVDEADRLNITTIEHLRDLYNRHGFGLILIGMPGIEKRLARYAQFYSRIGFAHEFRTLSDEEMRFILQHHWLQLGLILELSDFTDMEAVSAIVRITRGNFRLLQRLFTQIRRIINVNALTTVTREVVEAATECLVIGNVE